MDIDQNTLVAVDNNVAEMRGSNTNAKTSLALIIQSHPNLSRIGEIAWLPSSQNHWQINRNTPEFSTLDSSVTQPLADPFLSRSPVQLRYIVGKGIEIDTSESAITVAVAEECIESPYIVDENRLLEGVCMTLSSRICVMIKYLSRPQNVSLSCEQMLGISPTLQQVKAQISQLQNINDPVLIRGSTGVGKELVAQALVSQSTRKDKPFISVNLSAIPPELAAAELFGNERGAFTGADKARPGYFKAAEGGTLFLDEIGEASPDIQVMLLRVLETSEIFPVGSQKPQSIDVRIITATDANLEHLAKQKKFRLPLLHRLAGYDINIPDLKHRSEDIGLLFTFFAQQAAKELGLENPFLAGSIQLPWIPTALMSLLVSYSWPGNIRQLRNVTRQIVINAQDSEQLALTDSQQELLRSLATEVNLSETRSLVKGQSTVRRRKPNTVTQDELEAALEMHLWQLQAVADHLNISRASVYELLNRYQLRRPTDCNEQQLRQSYNRHQGNIEAMVFDLKMSKHAIRRRLNEYGIVTSQSA